MLMEYLHICKYSGKNSAYKTTWAVLSMCLLQCTTVIPLNQWEGCHDFFARNVLCSERLTSTRLRAAWHTFTLLLLKMYITTWILMTYPYHSEAWDFLLHPAHERGSKGCGNTGKAVKQGNKTQ